MDALIRDRIDHFTDPEKRVGATFVPGMGTFIRLWAPDANCVDIEWAGGEKFRLEPKERGYFSGFFPARKPGDRYYYILDGHKYIPDPASRYQPEGVFGQTEIFGTDYEWGDDKNRAPYKEWVIYEIHVGAFSETHNFEGIIADLPRLKELGINAIEIMPVSQFTGERNWGYDGVFPHAVQNTYGGPHGLKALVDACHRAQVAVILDVVYNHLGPEGNVLSKCGPYTDDKHSMPWGEAINFDDKESEEIRLYFLQSAWQWLTEFRIDGLRLDAIQNIFDHSAVPFLEEICQLKVAAEKEVGHKLFLIAETDTNDSRILKTGSEKIGFDAQWADDFHHNIHALLTGEKDGYYEDYGSLEQQARIYREGVAYSGQYSTYRQRRYGRPYANVEKNRLIVEVQNHDQIGNRLCGERLSKLLGFEKLKLASACQFLSPFTPLIFMGEEFYAKSPFFYFVSYASKKLLEKTKKKRAEEWKDFFWDTSSPDPGAIKTFEKSVLKEKCPTDPAAVALNDYFKTLIGLSKKIRAATLVDVIFDRDKDSIGLDYRTDAGKIIVHFSFSGREGELRLENVKNCLLRSTDFRPGRTKPDRHQTGGIFRIDPYSAHVFEIRST